LGKSWQEWEIPRDSGKGWPPAATAAHTLWWQGRIARQREIDRAIAERAEQEFLYDKPYEDSSRVRVSGPFTVESLSPHQVIPTDDDALWEDMAAAEALEQGHLLAAVEIRAFLAAWAQGACRQKCADFDSCQQVVVPRGVTGLTGPPLPQRRSPQDHASVRAVRWAAIRLLAPWQRSR